MTLFNIALSTILVCCRILHVNSQTNFGHFNFDLKVLEYENTKDVNINGKKCETFHFMTSDYCDPKFKICVSSDAKSSCDIYAKTTSRYTDKKRISHIKSASVFKLINIRESNWLRFNVNVYDHDKNKDNEVIARFSRAFQIESSPKAKIEKLYQRSGTTLTLSVHITCKSSWFGEKCNINCEVPIDANYRCDPTNGRKIPEISCATDEKLKYNKTFYCETIKPPSTTKLTTEGALSVPSNATDAVPVRNTDSLRAHLEQHSRAPLQTGKISLLPIYLVMAGVLLVCLVLILVVMRMRVTNKRFRAMTRHSCDDKVMFQQHSHSEDNAYEIGSSLQSSNNRENHNNIYNNRNNNGNFISEDCVYEEVDRNIETGYYQENSDYEHFT